MGGEAAMKGHDKPPHVLGCPQVMHMYSRDRSRPKAPTHSWTSELVCLLVQKRYER